MTARTQPGRRQQSPAEGHQKPPSSREATRRRAWPSVVAGLLVALAVVVAGVAFAATRPPTWTAETKLLVGPGVQADSSNISAYYETLSRGQVTATAAEIIAEPRFLRGAVQSMSAAGAGTDRTVQARVTVVPGTSLVSVSVTAASVPAAEEVADAIARASVPAVNRLLAPYAATPLGSADGSAEASGISTAQLAAVIALVAVVAGVGMQQLVRRSARASAQRPDPAAV